MLSLHSHVLQESPDQENIKQNQYHYSEARRAELCLLSEASFLVLYNYGEVRRTELRLLSKASFPVLYLYSEVRRAELRLLSEASFPVLSDFSWSSVTVAVLPTPAQALR